MPPRPTGDTILPLWALWVKFPLSSSLHEPTLGSSLLQPIPSPNHEQGGTMSRVRIAGFIIGIAVVTSVFAGCGSSGTKLASPSTTTNASQGTTSTNTSSVPLAIPVNYHPKIDPAKFTNKITNK